MMLLNVLFIITSFHLTCFRYNFLVTVHIISVIVVLSLMNAIHLQLNTAVLAPAL